MHLDKFVSSNTGKYLMSVILGIGLATFFRAVCKGSRCKIIRAPPLEEIDNEIYKYGEKCYKLEKVATKCERSKRILKFSS
jgi:hypothetical protein